MTEILPETSVEGPTILREVVPCAAELKAAKNRDVTIKAFPKLNHLFQTSQTGLVSEYKTIEETMSPLVLATIAQWLAERTLRKVKINVS